MKSKIGRIYQYPIGRNNHHHMPLTNMTYSGTHLNMNPLLRGFKASTTRRIISLTEDFTTTSTTESPLSGYVAWYWVALGLIVPVLLGTLFCVLDHLRRKKGRSPKHTEQRLESMCERNKYVPPKYDEIIPNNHMIIIESVPGLEVATTQSQIAPPKSNQKVFTVQSELAASFSQLSSKSVPELIPSTAFHPGSPSMSSTDHFSINSSTTFDVEDTSGVYTTNAVDDLTGFDDVDLSSPSPPSYDEYHKYELFGSRAELV